jgi:hypothetical protein
MLETIKTCPWPRARRSRPNRVHRSEGVTTWSCSIALARSGCASATSPKKKKPALFTSTSTSTPRAFTAS